MKWKHYKRNGREVREGIPDTNCLPKTGTSYPAVLGR